MTPRTGRPKAENPRTVNRAIRVTPEEDRAISAAAERDLMPIAEWARAVLLDAARRPLPKRITSRFAQAADE